MIHYSDEFPKENYSDYIKVSYMNGICFFLEYFTTGSDIVTIIDNMAGVVPN